MSTIIMDLKALEPESEAACNKTAEAISANCKQGCCPIPLRDSVLRAERMTNASLHLWDFAAFNGP
jgi:hypothetical protein